MKTKSNLKQVGHLKDLRRALTMGSFGALICIASVASAGRGDHKPGPEREKFRAAMDACRAETGVKKVRGEKPSEADREKIDACLKAKGIEKPPHKHRRHGPRDENGRPPSPPPKGEAPPPAPPAEEPAPPSED